MARKPHFFAWAAPANDMNIFPDHTWVTTYDNRVTGHKDVGAVVAAKEHFWFCWGNFRSKGGSPASPDGALGYRDGDLQEALCLVQPDAACDVEPAARGTIFRYGRNGVCHQLANQVLYATRTETQAPLTVSEARGYWASSFRYGTYGTPELEWDTKRDSCEARRSLMPRRPKGEETMAQNNDEFESRARDILKDEDPNVFLELLKLRREAQALSSDDNGTRTKVLNAAAINADNQRMLDRAAELLGPKNFERLFGFLSKQRVNLVAPELLREAERAAAIASKRPDELPATMFQMPRQATRMARQMTKSQLVEVIAQEHELAKKDVKGVLETLATIGYKELKKTGVFLVPGFAKFVVIKKPATRARKGTNPFTGEPIMFKAKPARKIVQARPVKSAKDAV